MNIVGILDPPLYPDLAAYFRDPSLAAVLCRHLTLRPRDQFGTSSSFRLKNLGPAWYIPILSSAGVGLLVLSAWRRRGIVRIVFLALFAVVCGFEWFIFAVAARSPAYTGPAQPGRKVPQFAARLADGTPFTTAELERGTWAVMVFYRGHW